MIESKQKEEISKSYLNALCAIKGIAMDVHQHDDDGIDVFLSKRIQRNSGSWFDAQMRVQLKSTSSSSSYREQDQQYAYRLKLKNYNDLRKPATTKPYLFLLILPTLDTDWVTHSVEQIIIKRCMFWLDLKGKPDTKNTSSVTVHFPKANVVSPERLDEILLEIAENG